MTNFILLFLACTLCIVGGFFIGKIISKLRSEKEQIGMKEKNNNLLALLQETKEKNEALQNSKEADLEKLRDENKQLNIDITQANAALQNSEKALRDNKKEIEQLQEKFSKEFENLANKILDEKSKKFKEQNKESIHEILNPLKEKIQNFEKKVEDTNKESIGRHSALNEQIKGLKEINSKMSQEAVNLTKALKGDSKVQGDWGETQLEVILEKAKLSKEIHYTTQGGFRDDEGKLKKPDFVVNLPDNRHLIIDSKVSLTNYEAFHSAETENEKELHLTKHIDSIKKHIKELSEKKYAELYEINAPDYVIMFVPIEPALMLALTKNNNLYLDALDRNIVLVSTSTLLATLSTVSSMWRQENQKKNILEIASQAGKLYDQFVNLTDDLIKVGNQLKTVQGSYDSSMKKLTGRGNLIKKVENIKKLGVKTNKDFNQNLLDRAIEE